MPDATKGKYPAPWCERRRRAVVMRRCVCGHGKDAHRDGRGYCIGERQVRRDQYEDCACHRYDEQRPEPGEPLEHYPLGGHSFIDDTSGASGVDGDA